MYAVIKAGGKQHRVKPGDVIEVEFAHGGHDESITFTPVLVVDDDGKTHYGKDLGKAVVKGRLIGEGKGEKIKVFKYRPKTGYARRQGHRQMYTLVEIQDVSLGRRAGPKKAEENEPAPEEVGAVTEATAPAPAKSAAGSRKRPRRAPDEEVEGA
jgi:large subunit ribosomal protein L21